MSYFQKKSLVQKIGLTGATGHLGSVVQKALSEKAIPLKLLLRRSDNHFAQEECVIGDLYNDETLSQFVHGCTAVIHSAGMALAAKREEPRSDRDKPRSNHKAFQSLSEARS